MEPASPPSIVTNAKGRILLTEEKAEGDTAKTPCPLSDHYQSCGGKKESWPGRFLVAQVFQPFPAIPSKPKEDKEEKEEQPLPAFLRPESAFLPNVPQAPMTGFRFGLGKDGGLQVEPLKQEIPEEIAPKWTIPPLHLKFDANETPSKIEMRLKEAQDYFNKGLFKKAEKIAREVLAARPNNKMGLGILAFSLFGEGKVDAMAGPMRRLGALSPASPEYFTLRSYYELEKKNFKEALQWLNKWSASEPSELVPYALIMKTHMVLNETKAAVRVLERFKPATQREKASLAVLFYQVIDGPREGERRFRELIQEGTTDPGILGNFAYALYKTGKEEEAFALSEKALALKPDQIQALCVQFHNLSAQHFSGFLELEELAAVAGKLWPYFSKEKQLSFFEKRITANMDQSNLPVFFLPHPNFRWQVLRILVVNALDTEDIQTAKPLLELALRETPENAWGREKFSKATFTAFMAAIEFNEGQIQKARENFDKALALNPDEERIWMNYVNFLLKTNDVERARFYIGKLNQYPGWREMPKSLFQMAMLAFQEKKFEEAISYLEKLSSLEPKNAWVHNQLAVAFIRNNNTSRGTEEARLSLALGKTNTTPYKILSIEAEQKGNWEEFEKILEEGCRQFPDDFEFAWEVGEGYRNIYGVRINQNGLSPLAPNAQEKIFLARADKWLSHGYERRASTPLNAPTLFSARLWNGTLTLEEIAASGENSETKTYFQSMVLAQQGREQEALELLNRYERKMSGDSQNIEPVDFHHLIEKGAIHFAQAHFKAMRNNVTVNKDALVKTAEVILDNPFPPQAAPLVAMMAIYLGDQRYYLDDVEGAAKYYSRAVALDPKQEEGWVGLMNCYKELKMDAKLESTRQAYLRSKGHH